MTWAAFVIGVLANLATLPMTAFIIWLWFVFFGRSRLLKFFGIARGERLRIYVGRIDHQPEKDLVGFEEMNQAKNIEALFKSVVPGLGDQLGMLRFLRMTDIHTEILPGTPKSSDVTLECSFISLGLSTSNAASSLLEEELRCPVKYDRKTECIITPDCPPIDTGDLGFVARIRRGDMNYFYIGGLPESTTAGCARYLIQNWKSMRKKYGYTTSFYYVLQMRDGDRTAERKMDNELRIPK